MLDSPSVVVLVDLPDTVDETAERLAARIDGVSWVTATTSEAALETVKQQPVDCVVSNYEVPKGDGIEYLGGLDLLRSVRKYDSDLPFVIFAGVGNEDLAQEALSAGVTDYIHRWQQGPSYDRLARRVEAVLEARRSERRAERQANVNEVIRDVNQALVRADTRTEIEQSVCEQFTESEQYLLAWCGRQDETENGELVQTAVAGAERWDIGNEGTAGLRRAIDSGTICIEDAVVPERSVAEGSSGQSPIKLAIVPFLYDGECFGVLGLYTDRADAFGESEREVLSELGETIAYALDAVRTRQEIERREQTLKEQNERLDQFVSIVSHDLRNPLSVATGYLDLARTSDDNEEYLLEVGQSLKRMEQMIGELLKLARMGQRVGDIDSVSLEDVTKEAWSNVETMGAELRTGSIGTVEADRQRLVQLFENLFRNAVEHGPTSNKLQTDDSVEHGFAGSDPENPADDPTDEDSRNPYRGTSSVVVQVGTLDDGGFYLEDDGPGIDETEQERVFEMGYTTNSQGTGFGLGIVSDIVDGHGWDIDVCEGSDGGARFEIRTENN